MDEEAVLEALTAECKQDLHSSDGETMGWYVRGMYERFKAELEGTAAPMSVPDALYQTACTSIEAQFSALRSQESYTVLPTPQEHPDCIFCWGDWIYGPRRFSNWGQTVQRRMRRIYTPTTVVDVQRYVRAAAAQGRRIRATGYQHTWSDFYPDTDQILLTMLPDRLVDHSHYVELEAHPRTNELQRIEYVGDHEGQKLCKVGPAISNGMLRRWLLNTPDENGMKWAYPLNVVMIENTVVGTVMNNCHGSGIRTQTMADLVYGFEYVDCDGNLVQVYEDKNEPRTVRALAGSFGVIGIVVSVTLKLISMLYTDLHIEKPSMFLAVPPRGIHDVPESMHHHYHTAMNGQSMELITDDWKRQITTDYYHETFWFPWNAQNVSYVVHFTTTANPDEADEEFPSRALTQLLKIESLTGDTILNNVSLNTLTQARLFSTFAMLSLPEDHGLKTPIINAFHFTRGVNLFRVKDFEAEIRIPKKPSSDELDLSVVQAAWWDTIKIFDSYRQRGLCPPNLTLEMRITGGTESVLAPQYENDATCSIEVLSTLPLTAEHVQQLKEFNTEVFRAWSSYKDAYGNPLPCRPHWAKEWNNIDGDALQVIEGVFHQQIDEFKNVLGVYFGGDVEKLERTKLRFGNALIDQLLWSQGQET